MVSMVVHCWPVLHDPFLQTQYRGGGAAQVPEFGLAVPHRAVCPHETAECGFAQVDADGHELDAGSFAAGPSLKGRLVDDQFDSRVSVGVGSIVPVSHADEAFSELSRKLDRARLRGADALDDMRGSPALAGWQDTFHLDGAAGRLGVTCE